MLHQLSLFIGENPAFSAFSLIFAFIIALHLVDGIHAAFKRKK